MEPSPALPETVRWRNLAFHSGKAVAFGMVLGSVITLAFRDYSHFREYLISSILCSLVIGLGFHLLPSRALEPNLGLSPGKAILLMQIKWMGLCMLLVAVSLGLLKLAFGPLFFINPITAILVALIGLLITSLAVGQHTATALLDRSRSLEQAQIRAGFLAIQAQLQPHTLFNALNTILALIRRNPDDAEAATRHLAKLLRRTTTALDQELWPLREEFELLEALLELERLRFGERLRYELELGEALREALVPPLMLVPLVENSLKHGFRMKVGPCFVSVRAQGRSIRVEDDGSGCAQPIVEGVGLHTVRERLEALGGRISWPEVPLGCAVELELP